MTLAIRAPDICRIHTTSPRLVSGTVRTRPSQLFMMRTRWGWRNRSFNCSRDSLTNIRISEERPSPRRTASRSIARISSSVKRMVNRSSRRSTWTSLGSASSLSLPASANRRNLSSSPASLLVYVDATALSWPSLNATIPPGGDAQPLRVDRWQCARGRQNTDCRPCVHAHKNGGAGHYFGHLSDTDLVSSDVTDITLGVLVVIPTSKPVVFNKRYASCLPMSDIIIIRRVPRKGTGHRQLASLVFGYLSVIADEKEITDMAMSRVGLR